MDNTIVLQRFTNVLDANELHHFLDENDFKSWVIDNSPPVDVALGGTHIDDEFLVNVLQKDYAEIKVLFDDLALSQIPDLPKDYYLFEFTNDELLDVLATYDEWGELDQLLAKQLLIDRGVSITDEGIEKIKAERLEILAIPESPSLKMLVLGYIAAAAGGILGLVVGWTLISKKPLPDGRKVPNYTDEGVKHGLTILFLSFVMIVITTISIFLREWIKAIIS